MDRVSQFMLAVQTGILAECSAPSYRTVSDRRRGIDSVELLRRAHQLAPSIPDDVCPFDAALSFLKWIRNPDTQSNAPRWLQDFLRESQQ